MTYTIVYVGPLVRAKKEGYYHTVIFRGSDGKTYRTYIDPSMRNYAQWERLLKREGAVVTGLRFAVKGLIDADSVPVEVK